MAKAWIYKDFCPLSRAILSIAKYAIPSTWFPQDPINLPTKMFLECFIVETRYVRSA